MTRRPTASRSERDRLGARLDDVAEDLDDKFGGEEIHQPDPFPFIIWASQTEETLVDEEHNIHRMGGKLWAVPQHPSWVDEFMEDDP